MKQLPDKTSSKQEATPKKKRGGQYRKRIVAIGLILIVSGSSAWYFYSRSRQQKQRTSTIQTAEVTTGTIKNSIEGTGTLSYADETTLSLPEDLKIKEILVSAGEEVKKGTLLATVEEASLYSAIQEIEEALTSANKKIANSSTSTTKSVKAGVAGRIKKINIKTGSNAATAVQKKGALMLLSTDGKMQVTLKMNTTLSVGDSVTVTGASGQSKTGTVERVTDSKATITMSDQSFAVNESVSVKKGSKKVGTGKAAIHQPVKILAESGTVSSVCVQKNDSVTASTTVCTLNNAMPSASYQKAVKQREALQDLLAELITIQNAGGICATQAGTVTEINVTASSTTSTDSTSSSTTATTTSTSSQSSKKESAKSTASSSGFTTCVSKTGSGSSSHFSTLSVQTSSEKVTATATASESQSASETETNAPATTAATATTEAPPSLPQQQTTEAASQSAATSETASEQDAKKTEQSTEAVKKAESSAQNEKNSAPDRATTVQSTTETANTSNKETKEKQSAQKSPTALPASSGNSAQSATSSSTVSQTSTTTVTDDISTVAAFSIARQGTMKLTVNVDEMDISSMKTGAEAEISVDALEDQTFEGTISKVSKEASTSNGVTQYPVEITLNQEDGMLSGMNASASILLEKKENVLVLPTAAISDRGNSSYVYTAATDDTLSGEQEVTTGLSDDSQVEITSGLKQGDTVYYKIAGKSSDNSQSGKDNGGFPGNGDGMPQGGQAPDGNKGNSRPDGNGNPGGQAPGGMGNSKN